MNKKKVVFFAVLVVVIFGWWISISSERSEQVASSTVEHSTSDVITDANRERQLVAHQQCLVHPSQKMSKAQVKSCVAAQRAYRPDVINLSYRGITELPDIFQDMGGVVFLNLAGNELEKLPPSVAHMQDLQRVLISSNRFTEVPAVLSELASLKEIDLSRNPLEDLSNLVGMASLEVLHLRLLDSPPVLPELANMHSLVYLDISNTSWSQVPDIVFDLTSLEYLNLSSAGISQIPSGISRLKKMRGLSLNDNKLASLPVEIGELKGLVFLEASSNRLSVLPESLAFLPNLNRIVPEHEGIGFGLSMSSERPYREVYRDTGFVSRLSGIDVSGNDIASVPLSFCRVFNIDFTGNPVDVQQLTNNCEEGSTVK